RAGTGRLRRQLPPHVRQRAHGCGAGVGGRQRALLRPDADEHEARRAGSTPAADRQLPETAHGAGGERIRWRLTPAAAPTETARPPRSTQPAGRTPAVSAPPPGRAAGGTPTGARARAPAREGPRPAAPRAGAARPGRR